MGTFSSFERILEIGLVSWLLCFTIMDHAQHLKQKGFVTLVQPATCMPLFVCKADSVQMFAASYLSVGIISHRQATERIRLHFLETRVTHCVWSWALVCMLESAGICGCESLEMKVVYSLVGSIWHFFFSDAFLSLMKKMVTFRFCDTQRASGYSEILASQ